MNTTKNAIIAEFMGYEIQKDPTERFFGRYKSPITKVWTKENELSFDTDWNWLMEVVEKIFNTVDEVRDNDNDWDFLTKQIRDSFYFPNKEAVYNACLASAGSRFGAGARVGRPLVPGRPDHTPARST